MLFSYEFSSTFTKSRHREEIISFILVSAKCYLHKSSIASSLLPIASFAICYAQHTIQNWVYSEIFEWSFFRGEEKLFKA